MPSHAIAEHLFVASVLVEDIEVVAEARDNEAHIKLPKHLHALKVGLVDHLIHNVAYM